MEGRVFSYIHFNGQVGSMVKISTITDFAARTDEFISFGKNIAMQIAMTNPNTIADLLQESYIKQDDIIISKLVDDLSKTLGENIVLIDMARFSIK